MSSPNRYRVIGIASTTAGFALFVYLVYTTGIATIVESVRQCGSIFVVLLAISGVRHVSRTAAWYLCIDREQRTVSFLDLFNIRLAGEAVTDLTFAGPLLGETAKALAISRRIPATDTLSSIVIENLVYSLSVVLFILSGAVAFALGVALPEREKIAVVLVGVGLVVPVAAVQLAIQRRWMLVSGLLGRLNARNVRVPALERRRENIVRFEHQVVEFYASRRGLFFSVFGLELLTNVTGVVEAYLILSVMTGHTSLFAAYTIETVNRAVNAVFPFLPLRVGVDEGGAALALTALGYTAADGVALSIVRKIRSLVWVGIGLLCMARYAVWKR